jgi:glutamate dehydrogenase
MRFGEEATPRLFATYAEAFPAAYQDEVPAAEAPEDIAIVESLEKPDDIGLNLYRHQDDPPDSARFKLFRVGAPVPLSECLPMIENMGFKVMTERPYDLRRPGAPEVWIHDFFLREPAGGAVDVAGLRSRFEDAFAHVWRGEVESDGFNRLVLCAGLSWREIVILRAYGKFMRQGGTTFSQAYIESALARNGRLANMLVEYFYARLDPQPARATAAARASAIAEEFIAGLEAVTSLDEDRILRQYRDLIANTLRTNFFQTTEEGAPKSVFSVKLDSRRLEELPLPRPFVEIFVYSPRVEGVHLRGE